ncbi:MAG: HNH endonuclease signature motif containing protein [Methylotenera sp.]|jgi:hypothetical protein|nr:HNH endonuclease signature motif containing protein [Methylotenera sp.]MDD4927000.1 HNH endonuclease signature motif containing protein [Methylotenera sp.]
MWNLAPLTIENYRDYIDIAFPVGAIPEEISEIEKTQLISFYELYIEKLGRPLEELKGNDTRAEFRQFVHDAYDYVQDRRRLSNYRADLKLLAESCPYCGYGPIEELDHLLQRGQYKLFSIFSLNLVPSCGACNKGKPKIPSADANKNQIHVYLEDLSGYDFLKAEASIDNGTGGLEVLYSITKCQGMTDELYERLVHHLTEFDLNIRYVKQINIFLGGLEYSITSSFQDGGALALKVYLQGSAIALQKRFGTNDWRTALIRGLAECPAFYEGGFMKALGLKVLP